MRLAALAALLIFASLAPPGRASACRRRLEVTPLVQRGPTCAAAAATMVARALGATLDLAELVRAIPVWSDGVSYFDLEEALLARGLRGLTFRGGGALAARLLMAGLPVVATIVRHGERHALTLSAVDGCGATLRFEGYDPATGAALRVTAGELAALQPDGQLFVVWPTHDGWEARLRAAGIELDVLVGEDRRFRAEELVLRAARHRVVNDQMLELLERAVREDPTFELALRRRDAVKEVLRRRP